MRKKILFLSIILSLLAVSITGIFFLKNQNNKEGKDNKAILGIESSALGSVEELGYNVPVTFKNAVSFNGDVLINGKPLNTKPETTIVQQAAGVLYPQEQKGSSQNNNNDTLEIAAGNGINISTDNNKITISSPTPSSSFSNITSGANPNTLTIGYTGSLTYYLGNPIPGAINANFLEGQTWSSPSPLGTISPSSAIFTNLTINGTTQFPTLSSGIAQINSLGQLISSSLNLNSNSLTGILPLSLGGTGATTSSQLRSSLNLGSLALENNDTASLTKYLPLTGGTLTGNLTINGTTQFSALSSGIAQINSLGQLTSSPLNLSGNYLTGILPLSLGGTGTTTSAELRNSLNLGSLALENTNTTSLTNYLPLSGGTLTGDLTLNSSSIRTSTNQILSLIPNGTGYTRIGDAGVTSHGLNTNDDLFASGRLEVNGISYLNGGINLNNNAKLDGNTNGVVKITGNLLITPNSDNNSVVKITNAAGGYLFSFDSALSQINVVSVIPKSDNNRNLGSNSLRFNSGYIVNNYSSYISTLSNSNLSIAPNGTGYTIIGNAGTTSHSLNTNDDLLITGRLEVNGQSYFDNHLVVGGASLCVKSSSSACAGNTAGTLYASNTTVQSADVAENYISSQQLESGDLVMPDKSSDQAVLKTTAKNQSSVIGVVSSKPGITLNSDAKTDNAHPYLYPIALSGRVPVKVSTENGNISVGDLLTTSSTPGVAMKATKNGAFIGKALQEYNGNGINKIIVFITLSSTLPSDITLELSPPNTPYDLASLQSQISSLSAQILNLPDISNILSRLQILESKVASISADTSQPNLSGNGIIQKGQIETKISNNNITDNSKILITPTSMTDKPLIIKEKNPGDSFTVGIASTSSADITFDWLVINK